MDWDRFEELNKLIALQRAGEVISELTRMVELELDPTNKGVLLNSLAAAFRALGRSSEARGKIREARAVLGPENVAYPGAAYFEVLLDADERKWGAALRKLDVILENYGPLLREDLHGNLLQEIQRYRGMALAELGRYREARPLLESARSIEYEKQRTLCYLAGCDLELGDLAAARNVVNELRSMATNGYFPAYACYLSGKIFFAEKQLARAMSEFEKCLGYSEKGEIEGALIQSLIMCARALNLHDEVRRYSRMAKKAHRGQAADP